MALQYTHPHHPKPAPQGIASLGLERAYQTLAEFLPGYERRPEQYQLTSAIFQALTSGVNLVAEAPTGTGKSFAAILPVIAAFLGTEKRVVISTANNNLLEQYVKKDLHFLKSIFPDLTYSRAKGKNNYLCVDKASKVFEGQILYMDGLKKMKSWYESTQTGDKEEIDFPVTATEWGSVNVDDTCIGKNCPMFNQCFYFRAKEDLKDSRVIVTNHDLLLLNQFIPEAQLLPSFDAVILDEAHQLEEKAISKLEKSLTERQVERLINATRKPASKEDKRFESVELAKTRLFNAYKAIAGNKQEKKLLYPVPELFLLTKAFISAMGLLKEVIGPPVQIPTTREEKTHKNLYENIDQAIDIVNTVSNGSTGKNVTWIDPNEGNTKIVTAPFTVAGKLHEYLFSDTMPVICMSATISMKSTPQYATNADGSIVQVGGSPFEQFRKRVGMVEAAEFECPSPFNYKENCVLYLPEAPEGAKEPTKQADVWSKWALGQIKELVTLSKGRALILTTSSKAMKDIGGSLFGSIPYPVKIQGKDGSNSQLIEWFKETNNAILVGTASFWEGVSIEGDDLKLVIIDKIPFAPHTEPVHKARENWYDQDPARKSRKFMDLSVFPATLKLKQGFGRLNRTKTDTGVVAILDPRLTGKHFGRLILQNLPNATQTSDINDPKLLSLLR